MNPSKVRVSNRYTRGRCRGGVGGWGGGGGGYPQSAFLPNVNITPLGVAWELTESLHTSRLSEIRRRCAWVYGIYAMMRIRTGIFTEYYPIRSELVVYLTRQALGVGASREALGGGA